MSKKKHKKRYSYKRELHEYDIIMGNVALDFDADDDDDDDDDWGGAHPIIPEWMCKFVEGEESDEDDPRNSKLSKAEREELRVKQVMEDSRRDMLLVEEKPFLKEYRRMIKDGKDPFKLNKKKLDAYEIAQYKQFGKPDLTQNYLEWVGPDIRHDLMAILHAPLDNVSKAEIMERELKHLGFRILNNGTNITVMVNQYYPGVVFKFALDECGIADNFNDEVLQYRIPHFAKVYARDPVGLISVQERYAWVDAERLADFRDEIYDLLEELAKDYIVADLSPKRFFNYAVGRDGDFVIIDGSDLYPINYMPNGVRCVKLVGWDPDKEESIRCGHKMEYTDDFMYLKCKKCGATVNPLEVRPKRNSTGYTDEFRAISFESMHDGSTLAELRNIECLQLKVARELRKRYPDRWHDVDVNLLTDEIPIPDDGTLPKAKKPGLLEPEPEEQDDGHDNTAVSDEDTAKESNDLDYLADTRIDAVSMMMELHGYKSPDIRTSAGFVLEIEHMAETGASSVEFDEDDYPSVQVAVKFYNDFYTPVILDRDACSIYFEEDSDDECDDDDDDEEIDTELEALMRKITDSQPQGTTNPVPVGVYDDDEEEDDESDEDEPEQSDPEDEQKDMSNLLHRRSLYSEATHGLSDADGDESDDDDDVDDSEDFAEEPSGEEPTVHDQNVVATGQYVDDKYQYSIIPIKEPDPNSKVKFSIMDSKFGKDLVIDLGADVPWDNWTKDGANICISFGNNRIVYICGKDMFALMCKALIGKAEEEFDPDDFAKMMGTIGGE